MRELAVGCDDGEIGNYRKLAHAALITGEFIAPCSPIPGGGA
jgi:hypothetical protein